MGSIKEFFGNIIDKIEDAKESVFGDVFSKYEDAKAKKKLEQDEAEKTIYEECKNDIQKDLEFYDKNELEKIASTGKTGIYIKNYSNMYGKIPQRKVDARCKALREVSQEWNQHGDLPVRLRYEEKKTPFFHPGRCTSCALYMEWTMIELLKLNVERSMGKYME